MHKRITRAFMAVAAAGAALTTLGFAGVSAAASTGAPQAVPNVYTKNLAGYLTGGTRIRYVAATVKVRACRAHSGNKEAIIALAGRTQVAELSVRCGGGAGSVRFLDSPSRRGAFRLAPAVGDNLKISIFRDRQRSVDSFTAINARTGRTQTVKVHTSARVYRSGQLLAFFNNALVRNPDRDVLLWTFRNVHMTAYSGARGSVFGPWTTFRIVDTTNGRASGDVVASPSSPANHGRDFNIYLRHR